MKAEHRKELETNVLADRVGHLVERMKKPPQGRSVLYFIVALVVAVLLFVLYRLNIGSRQETAEQWLALENGHGQLISRLAGITEDKQKRPRLASEWEINNPGKAARFQAARFFLWDDGVRKLGGDARGALINIRFADDLYDSLEKECANEPTWHAEALYARAVIEESLSIQNPERLKKAQNKYSELAEKYKDSGYSKLAEKRAKELRENNEAITAFYRDLQTKFAVPDEKQLLPRGLQP